MRDIEFRAWSKRLGKYIEPSKVIIDGTGKAFVDDSLETDVKPKELVIEQYTGLKDKNGTNIFEGDVLEIHSFSPEIYDCDDLKILPAQEVKKLWEVVGDEGSFGIANEGHFFESLREINGGRQTMLVVGNIHENPELLEEEK